MALSKLLGQNFRAFVGGLAAAYAVVEETNVSVQISGNMEDDSTKDTENVWTTEAMTSKQWQIQVESLDATAARLKAIISQFNANSPVSVGFDQTAKTAGTQNRTPANAPFARSGQAHLTDVSISAPNRGNIQVSLTYQGTGALA
jgi:putative heme degradation protein